MTSVLEEIMGSGTGEKLWVVGQSIRMHLILCYLYRVNTSYSDGSPLFMLFYVIIYSYINEKVFHGSDKYPKHNQLLTEILATL